MFLQGRFKKGQKGACLSPVDVDNSFFISLQTFILNTCPIFDRPHFLDYQTFLFLACKVFPEDYTLLEI